MVIALALTLLGAIYSQLMGGDSISTTIQPGSLNTEAAYIVFAEASTAYMKNGSTGAIQFSSSDAASVINNALGNLTPGRTHPEKVLVKGDFAISKMLRPDSYTILEILGAIRLTNGANTDIIRISGKTQVEIFGGCLDGNKANQVSATRLVNIQGGSSDVFIHDMNIKDSYYDGICVNGSSQILIRGIKLSGIEGHAVFVGYTSSYVTVTDIVSIDPTLEHVCIEWPASEASWNHHITVSNVIGRGGEHHGIYIEHVRQCVLTNIIVEDMDQYGFYVDKCEDVGLTNCIANHTTTAYRYPFYINTGADRVILEGCFALNGQNLGFVINSNYTVLSHCQTMNCDAPFEVNDGKTKNLLVHGCIFSKFSGQVYLQGVNITVKDNQWVNPTSTPPRVIYVYAVGVNMRIVDNDINVPVSVARITVQAGSDCYIAGNTGYPTENDNRTLWLEHWKEIDVSTAGGWTPSNNGTAGTSTIPFRIYLYTGTTANSRGLLYATCYGLNSGNRLHTAIDYGERMEWSFTIVRETSDTEAVARIQLKQVNTEGQLADVGIGIQIDNLGLTGEAYASARGTASLGVTLVHQRIARIRIVLDPGVSVKFYVDDVLCATLTGTAVPTGVSTISYMVASIKNGATGGVNPTFSLGDIRIIQEW